MSNPSTVSGFVGSGTGRNLWPVQTVATATETILKVGTDVGTSANFFLVAPTGGQVYGAASPLSVNGNSAITQRSGRTYGIPSGSSNDQFSSASWDGHPFRVRISGIGNAGANAAQNVAINLYQGTSATIASDHIIGTTGATFATVAGGAFHFYIEATLLWDATSQILSGSFQADIAFAAVDQYTVPTAIGPAGAAAPITSITSAGLSFLASIKLGNAASSTVTVREFVIDEV